MEGKSFFSVVKIKFDTSKDYHFTPAGRPIKQNILFTIRLGEEGNVFSQNGNFRSEYDRKEFTDLKSCKKAIEKVLKDERAYVVGVSIDYDAKVFDRNDTTASSNAVLNALKFATDNLKIE